MCSHSPPVSRYTCTSSPAACRSRTEAWTRPDFDFIAEQFLAALDQHGMGFGVISAVTLVEVLAHRRDLPELLPVLEASDVKVVSITWPIRTGNSVSSRRGSLQPCVR